MYLETEIVCSLAVCRWTPKQLCRTCRVEFAVLFSHSSHPNVTTASSIFVLSSLFHHLFETPPSSSSSRHCGCLTVSCLDVYSHTPIFDDGYASTSSAVSSPGGLLARRDRT